MRADAAVRDRLELPDSIRGLALVLILPANLLIAGVAGQSDGAATLLLRFLTEGKGFALFAFLFGWGFAVLLERGVGPRRYLRRMAVLGLIGLVHALLLWPGDILLPYALVGCLLLPFRGADATRMAGLAVVALVIPSVHLAATLALGDDVSTILPLRIAAGPFDLDAWWAQLVGLMSYGWTIMGCMLIGMAARRTRLLTSAPTLDRYALVLAALGTLLHLPLLLTWLTPGVWASIWVITSPLAGSALAGFYVLVALRWGLPRALSRLGRMPLTHYTTQSVVLVMLAFASITGTWVIIGVTTATVGLQYGFSVAWLRRHHRGPFESYWRCLSGDSRGGGAITDPSAVEEA